MYEVNSAWMKYFRELDPRKRKEELDRLLSEDDSSDLQFAKELFERRHSDKKSYTPDVDRFLFNCISFISLHRGSKLFKGSHKRTINKMMDEMGLNIAKTNEELAILYNELRNVIARYFSTCKSPDYKKKLFGMMKSSEDERQYHVLKDAWNMSVGCAEKFDAKDKMELWNKAVYDEYSTLYEGAGKDLESFTGR